MSYTSPSFSLVCDPRTKQIEIQDHARKIPIWEDAANLSASNPLYPLALPIEILAQGILGIRLSYLTIKIQRAEKKLSQLNSLPTADFVEKKTERLSKLFHRQKKTVEKVRQEIQLVEMQEVSSERFDKVTSQYIQLKERVDKAIANGEDPLDEDFDDHHLGDRLDSLYKEMVLSDRQLRTQREIDALSEKDPMELKKMFTDRAECGVIKYKILKSLCLEDLKNVAKMEIPLIGMLYFSHSKKGGDQVIDQVLLERYNAIVQDNPWLKFFNTDIG